MAVGGGPPMVGRAATGLVRLRHHTPLAVEPHVGDLAAPRHG